MYSKGRIYLLNTSQSPGTWQRWGAPPPLLAHKLSMDPSRQPTLRLLHALYHPTPPQMHGKRFPSPSFKQRIPSPCHGPSSGDLPAAWKYTMHVVRLGQTMHNHCCTRSTSRPEMTFYLSKIRDDFHPSCIYLRLLCLSRQFVLTLS